jgi:protein-disulfide isomerase
MKRGILWLAMLLTLAPVAVTQTPPSGTAPAPAQLQQRVEAFVRKVYAWGPSFQVIVGIPKDSNFPGFYEVTIQVRVGGQSDTGTMWVSKDGRFLVRGEINDLNVDPFAAARQQIKLEGSPSLGPADARVVVVDYSDFQCPHCRQLDTDLRALAARFPQVRFVSKYFPLAQIHPWAMTAATAAWCASKQNPQAYWAYHHSLFDNQDSITAENAWQQVQNLATQAGLDAAAIRSCMATPEAKAAIDADVKEGVALNIANTPTVFINGRRIVGGDRNILEQYISYELTAPPSPAPRPRTP